LSSNLLSPGSLGGFKNKGDFLGVNRIVEIRQMLFGISTQGARMLNPVVKKVFHDYSPRYLFVPHDA
jgi:hypothetical protein